MMQQKYNQGVIDSVTEWIMANLDQRLSIDDIALKSGYSKWYLQKLFARYHNETLARYIRKKKLICCVNELKFSRTRLSVWRLNTISKVSNPLPARLNR